MTVEVLLADESYAKLVFIQPCERSMPKSMNSTNTLVKTFRCGDILQMFFKIIFQP